MEMAVFTKASRRDEADCGDWVHGQCNLHQPWLQGRTREPASLPLPPLPTGVRAPPSWASAAANGMARRFAAACRGAERRS